MEALFYFAIWAGLIFVMMRFGCGAHVMGHGHGNGGGHTSGDRARRQELRWIAPAKAVDPVCGKNVATHEAKPSVFDGDVYYFCSRECREVFEAAPDIYVRGGPRRGDRQLEHSHV